MKRTTKELTDHLNGTGKDNGYILEAATALYNTPISEIYRDAMLRDGQESLRRCTVYDTEIDIFFLMTFGKLMVEADKNPSGYIYKKPEESLRCLIDGVLPFYKRLFSNNR